MKKIILIILLILFQANAYTQTESDFSEIITEVIKLYKKENVKIYYQIQNAIYEGEIKLIEVDPNNPKSNILNFLNITYNDFRKIYRKTNNEPISKYFLTQTSDRLKDNNIAFIAIPIISDNGNSAIIFGRYSCGIACGQTSIFYFNKKESKWFITDLKIIS